MTDTLILPDEEVQEADQLDKFCHIRHDVCLSMNAVCGRFKPYPHSPGEDIYFTDTFCNICNKKICPWCLDIMARIISVDRCPQCNEIW